MSGGGGDAELCEVLVTADDEAWLVGLTKELIAERLVACGHHARVRSVYVWGGEVHDEPEATVRLHTVRSHLDAIVAYVVARHPYDVPCVTATPVVGANPAYAAWVVESTS